MHFLSQIHARYQRGPRILVGRLTLIDGIGSTGVVRTECLDGRVIALKRRVPGDNPVISSWGTNQTGNFNFWVGRVDDTYYLKLRARAVTVDGVAITCGGARIDSIV